MVEAEEGKDQSNFVVSRALPSLEQASTTLHRCHHHNHPIRTIVSFRAKILTHSQVASLGPLAPRWNPHPMRGVELVVGEVAGDERILNSSSDSILCPGTGSPYPCVL